MPRPATSWRRILHPRRDAQAARVVLRKAMLAADKPPKTVTTDRLRSYIRPIKDIMPEARHIQSEGMRADINNNLSERLQGTFKDRTKTLRALDSRKTGQHYLDGWVLTYNNFRGHESLRNQTPGQRAKVNPPFREWADVVKAGAAPRPKVTGARPVSQSPRKLPPRQVAPSERNKAEKPLAEVPTVQGGGRARKRSRIRTPKPVFPKMSRKTKPRNLPPPWAKLRPRVPGKN